MKNTPSNNESVQKYEFKVNLGGSKRIELQSLSKFLNNFSVLTEESSKQVIDCKFDVIAINQGSFELVLECIVPVVSNLFTPDNVNYALNCFKTINEWFSIKKHLGFAPPKSIEKDRDHITITNEEGEVQVFSANGARFFENASINNSIINIGKVLNEAERESFKISDNDSDNLILNIEKDDYGKVASNIPIRNKDTIYISHVQADLLLDTAAFRGNAKWGFYFNKKIKAKIEDEVWLDEFQKSKHSLTYGAQMKVNMRIETLKDKNGNPMENTEKYYIEKVLDVVLPSYGNGN